MKISKLSSWLVVCLICACLTSSSPVKAHPNHGSELDWRSTLRCGPNSLYALLRLNGQKPDYSELLESIAISNRGVSVADLVTAAKNHGMELKALRVDARKLADIPLPAIIHMRAPNSEIDHFLLLLRWIKEPGQEQEFVVADCTYGDLRKLPLGDFLDQWTGIALVDNSRMLPRGRFDLSVALTCVSGALCILFGATRVRR